MRIELSIKTTYLPDWRTEAGIRELIQNAKDAETEFKSPMRVWHNGHTLKIENMGVLLPHEALLFGHTTKADNPETIGHFGEGLKLGTLALVRAGHVVRILSGDEIWKPLLVRSANFQAEVLAFDISKGKDCGGVIVEVNKIPLSEWNEMRANFLFLRDGLDRVAVEDYGELLLDPHMAGRVFVKGVFVQHEPRLLAGYNLFNAPTDRDRKVVASYDFGWRVATIWARAASIRPELVEKLYDMLAEGALDVNGLGAFSVNYMSMESQAALAAVFTRTFGADAIPVANILESKDLAHFGKSGIVLPAPMAKLLQAIMGLEGGIEAVKRKLGAEVVQRHSWLDLTDGERAILEEVVVLVGQAGEEVPMERLDIVSFRSPEQLGLWNGRMIVLSRATLSDRIKALTTLIHEYAHHLSEKGDGEKSHIAHIERIWGSVLAALMAGRTGQGSGDSR